MTISSSLGDMYARAKTPSRSLLSLAVIASLATAASTPPSSLPYVPTTILLPGSSGFSLPAQRDQDKVAYIFRPTSESSVDFLALDISTTLSASSLHLETLTSGLPFLKDANTTTTFTPSLLSNRTVVAYVGDCASQSGAPAVWTAPLPDSLTRNAELTWDYDGAPDATAATFVHSCKGPMFLGGAMSFSAQLSPTVSPPSVYYYGGMCPFTNQSGTDWTKSASYSNHVLKLGLPGDNAFNISPIVATGRSPGAQAGFTLTSLTPSISNRGDVVTQQLDSVVLGGHSALGYIDMGEAAIWSVPQETWKLIKVQQPNAGRTELAIKKNDLPDQVESRSGHTTVLSADGSKLVVLGGWVGDIKRAALPQLAILEVSADFTAWKWNIPAEQPQGQAIFGHGAAVLPGNIMMVYGGYSIAPESQDLASSRVKPRQSGASGEIPMFLNISSMTWSNEYINPERPAGSGDAHGQGSAHEAKKSNLGLSLGLGLGLGLGLIALTVAGYLLWRKRKRNHRRDSAVRALAQDASMFLPQSDMLEREDASFSRGWNSAQAYEWYTGGGDPFQRAARTRLISPSEGYESLRGASDPEGFSASTQKAVTRKPVGSRSLGGHLYMPPPLDLSPRSRGATEMNVIHEADEEVEAPIAEPAPTGVVVVQTRPISQESDPFLTPTEPNGFNVAWRQDESPRSSTGPGYTPDVQQWVQEAEEIDAEVTARIPSLRSMPQTTAIISSVPLQDSRPSSRSPTQRSPLSRALDVGNEAPSASIVDQGAIPSLSRSESIRSPPDHTRGVTGALVGNSNEDRNQDRSSGESSGEVVYKTANSSFSALQAEGPALLAGSSAAAAAANINTNQRRSLIGGTSPSQDEDDYEFQQGSPSKMKRRSSWFGLGTLGSLRRAVSSSGRRDSASSDAAARGAGGKTSSSECGVHQDPSHSGGGTVSRRRRQGREAWEVDASGSGKYGGPSTPPRRLSYRLDEEDEDWDIERASERRSVQYAFTVPREPLRVVNADVQRQSFDTTAQEEDSGEGRTEQKATAEVESDEFNPDKGKGRTGGYIGMESRQDVIFVGDAAGPSRARVASGSTPIVREPQIMGFPPGMPTGGDNEQDEGHLLVPTPRTPTFPRDLENDDRNAEGLESDGLSPRQQSDRRSFESRMSIDSSANHVIGLAQAVSLTRGSALPTPRPSPPTRVMEMVGRIEEEQQRGDSRQSSPARSAQMRK
ncbi:hypothetical protein MCOR16_007646 [Pyricularia oryzae]|nr:hypothetical protein MCOR15_003655 [Pyricularia oryzae]KAI6522143.1 hypothetical protein MCOR16_007646 [Pyricularia oryzae]